ncbi:PREDICTED: serine protease easter-like [Nicrophorus vespilloides]|uniref:Serine protease easter-like n=1 Tax=Nicrophorus vespilloides TaxID=110193 RepID=A0ABM1MKT0_NICVS|nr:PREDICTED: serine protease easter-like [Nicrophorus vespilloides]
MFVITLLILNTVVTSGVEACGKDLKCVPLSKCKVQMDVLYPCKEGYVCCPEEKTTRIISRISEFPVDCGLVDSDDRITGGKLARIGQFPWMSLLGYETNGINVTQFLCGGSLISRNYVLTAAHCLNLQGLKLSLVRLGEFNLATDKDCENFTKKIFCSDPYRDVVISKIIPHKDFSAVSLKNDIALLKLQNSISFTEFIQPICLPFDIELTPDMFYDKKLTVSGWGKINSDRVSGSDALMYATVKVWKTSRCNMSVPPEVLPIDDAQICANGRKGEDACKGDSGGPLFIVTNTQKSLKHHQIGIISFASAMVCGNAELPTVYTRVDHYLNWIKQNTE